MNEILIYEPFGAGGVTAKGIANQLKEFNGEDVTIRINSPGGSVAEGLAAYNQIKNYPGRKTVAIDGMALSMASGVAMAGDEIEMAANALMMVHMPSVTAQGDARRMQQIIAMLESSKDALVVAYSDRTGIDSSEIETMMDRETWLTAKEAKKLGFVDRISGEKAIAASFAMPSEITVPADMVGKVSTFFSTSKPTEETPDVADNKEKVEATPQSATLDQLLNLSGADDHFAVEQLKKKATLEQAQNALNAILLDKLKTAEEAAENARKEVDEVKRETPAPIGHQPVNNSRDDEGIEDESQVVNLESMIRAEMANTRGDAIKAYRNVHRKNKGLIEAIRTFASDDDE